MPERDRTHVISPAEVTLLLQRLRPGDAEAAERLAPVVYGELHDLAEAFMRNERVDHTLESAALVNEAWLKLSQQEHVHWANRSAFFGMAARIMRNLLVNHARDRSRQKRAGSRRRELLPVVIGCLDKQPLSPAELLDLEDALQKLEEVDARVASVIDLRFFGGLTIQETARALDLSASTVESDFRVGRAWLRKRLAGGAREAGGAPPAARPPERPGGVGTQQHLVAEREGVQGAAEDAERRRRGGDPQQGQGVGPGPPA